MKYEKDHVKAHAYVHVLKGEVFPLFSMLVYHLHTVDQHIAVERKNGSCRLVVQFIPKTNQRKRITKMFSYIPQKGQFILSLSLG